MIPKTAIIFFVCALLAGSSVAFGATGEYQQTRDGKTTVWNANAKPGESVAWAGSRDKEGYATGFGTITLYSATGTEYAVYYGNMVNGKLEGPVNMHMGRQTAHAYFADGNRTTAWARGPAPSKMNAPDELVAKRLKAESEQPKLREERAEVGKEATEKRTQPLETVRPVEQPQKQVVAETKPKATPVPTPAEENIEVPTPEPSIAPTNPPAIAEITPTLPTPEPTQSAASLVETTPTPTIGETPAAEEMPAVVTAAEETPQASTPEPSVEQEPKKVEQPAPAETAEKSEGDGSINFLVGPPSSLRDGSIPESDAASKTESRAQSKLFGTHGIAQLSEDDVIGLADTEARDKGCDLSEYQRPRADYSAVKDKWSLFYNLKDPKAAGGELQPFSVTVEDKTKKVEIRKNY
jgi:hypothetical protein